jgi:hypothetical protein
MKFNKYWIIVAGITIANIFIFVFFSNKLESYVTDSMVDESNQQLLNSLK